MIPHNMHIAFQLLMPPCGTSGLGACFDIRLGRASIIAAGRHLTVQIHIDRFYVPNCSSWHVQSNAP